MANNIQDAPTYGQPEILVPGDEFGYETLDAGQYAIREGDVVIYGSADSLRDMCRTVTAKLDELAPAPVASATTDTPEVTGRPAGESKPAPVDSGVHVVTYEHRHGMDIFVHATHEGAVEQGAKIARDNWREVAGEGGRPDQAPADDNEATRLYFDDHETEFLSNESKTVLA